MPINLTETSTFTPNVSVPVDADAANAASVQGPFGAVTNRTRWLRNYCTDNGVALPAALDTTRSLAHDSFVIRTATDWSRLDFRLQSEANAVWSQCDITRLLPRNASLLRVRVLVDPGIARATVGNRMQLVVNRWTVGTVGAPSYVGGLDTQANDDGTTNLQWMQVDFSATPRFVASGDIWTVNVRSGSDSGTNKDVLYALQVDIRCQTIRND